MRCQERGGSRLVLPSITRTTRGTGRCHGGGPRGKSAPWRVHPEPQPVLGRLVASSKPNEPGIEGGPPRGGAASEALIHHIVRSTEVIRGEEVLRSRASVWLALLSRSLRTNVSLGSLPSILEVLDESTDAVLCRQLCPESDLFIRDEAATLRHERKPS